MLRGLFRIIAFIAVLLVLLYILAFASRGLGRYGFKFWASQDEKVLQPLPLKGAAPAMAAASFSGTGMAGPLA